MLVDRYGARKIALGGVVIYALGLVLAILATSATLLTLGLGLCIGVALSCTASNVVKASNSGSFPQQFVKKTTGYATCVACVAAHRPWLRSLPAARHTLQ